ncbi:MAG: MFS transporter, partial [Thermoproteota archaeon]
QSMLSAIGAPAGSGLITALLPKNLRGRIIARVNKYATIGAMLGTLISGPLLDLLSFRLGSFLVFLIAALINLSGVIIFLYGIPDVKVSRKEEDLSNINHIFKNKNLRNLIVLRSLFTISVNIAAPYFNVYLVKKYNVSNTVISSLSIAANLFSIVSFNLWGEVVDRFGRVTVLTFSSMLTSVVPILWVLSDNLFLPLSSQILSGIAWSLVNVSLSAYLMDITYGGNVEVDVAFFNAAMGVSSFLGPILGGSIASYASSLEILFYLSGALRLVTGAASFKMLQEVHPHAKEITIESIVTSFSTLQLNFERNVRRIINVFPESQPQILEKIEKKIEKVAEEDKWMWLEEY